MTEAYFTPSEHNLLCEMLELWDHVQTLKRDVQARGVSQTDKAGVAQWAPRGPCARTQLDVVLS